MSILYLYEFSLFLIGPKIPENTMIFYNFQVLLFLSLLLPATPIAQSPGYVQPPVYPDEPAVYTYQYGVKDDYTSNNFGQSESRDGYSAQGEYFVNLPDGRLQKVYF